MSFSECAWLCFYRYERQSTADIDTNRSTNDNGSWIDTLLKMRGSMSTYIAKHCVLFEISSLQTFNLSNKINKFSIN